jgi:hypothetical protein
MTTGPIESAERAEPSQPSTDAQPQPAVHARVSQLWPPSPFPAAQRALLLVYGQQHQCGTQLRRPERTSSLLNADLFGDDTEPALYARLFLISVFDGIAGMRVTSFVAAAGGTDRMTYPDSGQPYRAYPGPRISLFLASAGSNPSPQDSQTSVSVIPRSFRGCLPPWPRMSRYWQEIWRQYCK